MKEMKKDLDEEKKAYLGLEITARKMEAKLAVLTCAQDAHRDESIEKFDIKWGDRNHTVSYVSIFSTVLILVALLIFDWVKLDMAVFFVGWSLVKMIWGASWGDWRICVLVVALFGACLYYITREIFLVLAPARRMKFGGHYIYEHVDQRPDAQATKEIKHLPRYGWIDYERVTFFGVKTSRLLISYEILSQLCSPDLMRIDRTEEVACAAIISAAARLPTVSYSRYLPLEGKDVVQNTSMVACAKFAHMASRLKKLDFGLPLAARK